MAVVAQLVEQRFVVPWVAGSNPVGRPNQTNLHVNQEIRATHQVHYYIRIPFYNQYIKR